MNKTSQKSKHEQLFDELIAVKLLFKIKEKKWKQLPAESTDKAGINGELATLKSRIRTIEKEISRFGENFYDVYDSELVPPLSESDILVLRDEIQEVRNSLEAMTG